MAAGCLTTASVVQCPHGASATAVPSSGRATAGAPLVTADDPWTIAGCTNSPPCKTVRWDVANEHTSVGGSAALSQDSVGTCMAGTVPQGAVVIVSTQARALSS